MSKLDTVAVHSGDDDFYKRVYEELRQLAHAKMSKEYVYSTLQGTALVHEAWVKLGGEEQPTWENRPHFFKAASEAMRRILIDRARKRQSRRHGGRLRRIDVETWSKVPGKFEIDEKLLLVNEALEKFNELDPEKAEFVKLRFFLGHSIDEAADAVGISRTTAKRWWVYARSWLFREMMEPDGLQS